MRNDEGKLKNSKVLETKDLTIKTITDKPLIEKLNMVLNEEDKLAIIGEEGNGKSTLLKAINNRSDIEPYCYITGDINKEGLVIGYLEQSLNPAWNNTYIHEFFLKENPSEDIDYDRYIELKDAAKILSKLRISPNILESDQEIGTLSGGEKVKIQIAKLLMKNPDVLLLDEPTNDLDIETLEWLEEFICTQSIPVLFVSHDETLLENTANTILHLEQIKSKNLARHTLKKISYGDYVKEREEQIAKLDQLSSMELREYKKDKQIISRQKSSVRTAQIKIKDSAVRRILNKKMRNILVQEKKAEDKRKTKRLETEDPIYMEFDKEIEIPEGKKILDLDIEELKIGDRVLVKNIELFVSGPRKIAIIGDNGIGKTTLLKQIYQLLQEREDINVGYMPQDYEDILKNDKVVMEYLIEDLDEVDLDRISSYMGRIKLNWDEMNGKINNLSYGQKAKLMILKMMLSGKNVLLLDEPTRNLSAISNPVIRDILKSFKGAVISISHDRKYLRQVCDTVYRLEKEGLREVEL